MRQKLFSSLFFYLFTPFKIPLLHRRVMTVISSIVSIRQMLPGLHKARPE